VCGSERKEREREGRDWEEFVLIEKGDGWERTIVSKQVI
jgi:hypothetical protein